MTCATGSLASAVFAGFTNIMYSRLRFGVYGQFTVTRVPSIGSRMLVLPAMMIARSVILIEVPPMPGSPLVELAMDTQVLLSISLGASAYAMLARSGCPRFE